MAVEIKKNDKCSNDYDRLIHIPKGFKELIPRLLMECPISDPRIKKVKRQAEYIFFYLSFIFLKQKHFHKEGDNDFVPLHSDVIRTYESKGEIFLKWLCERGLLESSQSYKIDEYAKSFKFKEDYEFEPHYLTNKSLITKISEERIKRTKEVMSHPILSKIFSRTSGVEILTEADDWVRCQGYKKTRERAILDNIALARSKDLDRGYFMVQGPFSHRIYSPHTHLPKEVRKRFLRIDFEEQKELDLKCSQFQILYIKFKDHLSANGQTDHLKQRFQSELKRYAQCFQEGNKDLYSLLGELRGVSREQMKKDLMPWLFSSYKKMDKSKDYRKISNLFKSMFPILFALIEKFKMTHKRSLAADLQQIESDAVIGKIALEKVYPEGFSFITIHDSIILPKKHFDHVKDIWEKTLKDLGFPQYLEVIKNPFEGTSEPISEIDEFLSVA